MPDIDGSQVLSFAVHVVAAGLLALPIAWQREQTTRTMGLRTFPLVAVATCGYVLLAATLFPDESDARARVVQGLMTGIGFIGGGAILKEGGTVRGTATAAGVWSTGAVGAAVGFDRYDLAAVISATTFLVLLLLTPLERETGKSDRPEAAEEK